VVGDNYGELLARQRLQVSDGLFSAVRRLGWSADRLALDRERRLRDLLGWAKEHSPFHAQRLAEVDVEQFTQADLASLPMMTKADLMGNFDQVLTDRALNLQLVNDHLDKTSQDAYLLDAYRVIATSGTTGARALFVYGFEDWVNFVLLATRWRARHDDGLPLNAPVGSLFTDDARHLSGALHAFSKDLSGGEAPLVTHLPVSSLSLPEVVAGLNSAQPLVLQGYPSAVHLLAREGQAGRLKISPRRVLTCGEQCTAETRAAVAESWGVEIYDYWGCSEGVYAFPCSKSRAMHLPDDLAIIEPVDRVGNPVAAGQPADKILLTNLYNRTQPLIRYEVTDAMTLVASPCECGCAHRQIADLAGRTDSYFTYGTDAAVHWLGMTTVLLANPKVVEFQVTQTHRGLDVSAVTKKDFDVEALRLGLIDLLNRSGLIDPQVNIAQVEALKRTWSGKLRQFQPLEQRSRGH
jgi:phenylacetate-coenzyme A ligase PaaK-like adenylate-forming protein